MKKRDSGHECVVCKAGEGFFEDVTPKLPWEEVNWTKERRGQRKAFQRGEPGVCKGRTGGRSVLSLGTWKLAGVAEGRKGGGGDKKAS